MARLIKRYANRKMYDVEASGYVSLEDVAALVRSGETVQIIDNVSGEDLTAQTLTQIVLEEGKRGRSVLPTELLHELLRRSGRALDTGLAPLRNGVEELVLGSFGRLTRVLQGPRTDELRQLREQIVNLEQTLGEILDERGVPRETREQSARDAGEATESNKPINPEPRDES